MTNSSPFGRRPVEPPKLPRGEVLGTYETHAEAQRIVDRLAKSEFEVSRISIVGNDLKTVERVTGRLSYGRAALAGAASGAWFGFFFGFLVLLATPNPALLGAAALIGAGAGMIFGLISYGLNRRTHDFTSMTQVLASNYQVLVDAEMLTRAQEALSRVEPTE